MQDTHPDIHPLAWREDIILRRALNPDGRQVTQVILRVTQGMDSEDLKVEPVPPEWFLSTVLHRMARDQLEVEARQALKASF